MSVTSIGKIQMTNTDTNNNSNVEPIGYLHININATDTAVVESLNTALRTLNGLTNNTYADTKITYDYQLNEILES